MTSFPSAFPSVKPVARRTASPTAHTTFEPTAIQSLIPSGVPSLIPSGVDSNVPSTVPLNREDRTFQLTSSYIFERSSSISTCSDDEDYEFLRGSGEKVGCGWLTQNKANAAKIIAK